MLILDLETTIVKSARKTANPFDPNNFIVCFAAMQPLISDEVIVSADVNLLMSYIDTNSILIGQNIKFDLLYLLQHTRDTKWLKGKHLYDTMFAEYLITGQESSFASLDKLSALYGGTIKDDRIKEYWNAGICTSQIPTDLLYEYAKYDILNTYKVYQGQQPHIKRLKMENLIASQMDDLLSTTLIENNGLKIDTDLSLAKINEIGEANYEPLRIFLPKALPFEFNWSSNDHLSALLFGGTITYLTREVIGQYKTGTRAGEEKQRWIENSYLFTRLSRNSGHSTKKSGVFKVNDDILCEIAKHATTPAGKIAKRVLEERNKSKQINTYYKPMIELADTYGMLHSELIHVQTNTGRLSSRNPNIQNWAKGSGSDIKACCVSRWGSKGSIVEIDASQLEIVVQAYLTQDERMINEIKLGTDFHCLRLAAKSGESYATVHNLCKVEKDVAWQQQRTKVKEFSFQRAYGAGAKAISSTTGMTEDDVKELIKTEDNLFPNVKIYNDSNIDEVNRTKSLVLKADETVGFGYITTLTGRQYRFYEEDAPDFLKKRGVQKSFSPTQIKNYPIQGFGAEVLAEFRGNIVRKLIGREDRVVAINTVHDSLIFDCRNEIRESFMKWLHEESTGVAKLMEKRYNIVVNVPFRFDISYGPNWKELKEYENSRN